MDCIILSKLRLCKLRKKLFPPPPIQCASIHMLNLVPLEERALLVLKFIIVSTNLHLYRNFSVQFVEKENDYSHKQIFTLNVVENFLDPSENQCMNNLECTLSQDVYIVMSQIVELKTMFPYICVFELWTQPEPKLLLRFHGLNNLELTSLRCLHRILINWSNVVLSNVVSKKKKSPCLFIWYSFPNVLN